MYYKLVIVSTLLSLWIAPVVVAEPVPACSQQAIEQANSFYLQEISNYVSEFSNQKNYAAVAELNKIKPKESFRKKHAKEIKQFNEPNYQPTQEFCDDVYANLEELKQQIDATIKKYGADKSNK